MSLQYLINNSLLYIPIIWIIIWIDRGEWSSRTFCKKKSWEKCWDYNCLHKSSKDFMRLLSCSNLHLSSCCFIIAKQCAKLPRYIIFTNLSISSISADNVQFLNISLRHLCRLSEHICYIKRYSHRYINNRGYTIVCAFSIANSGLNYMDIWNQRK